MRFLKAAVIIMGVLIIAGVAVIVAEIVKRASSRAASPAPVAADTTHPVETAVPLPPGSTVTTVTTTSDRIVLHVTVAGQPDRLLILDPHSAALRATVTLGATP